MITIAQTDYTRIFIKLIQTQYTEHLV